jgi:hypothetical protein
LSLEEKSAGLKWNKRMANSRIRILVLLAAIIDAAADCALTGNFFYSFNPKNIISFGPLQPDGATYFGTCTSSNCGWSNVTAIVDTVRPSWGRLQLTFDNGVISAAWLLDSTGNCSENVLYFGGAGMYSPQWCRVGNFNCTASFDSAWTGGKLHVLEVSHSDIGWLGEEDDMMVNSRNINASLDMMALDATFKWQHECIVSL